MATSKDYSQDDASTDTNDDTMSTGSVRDDVIQAPLSVNRTAHSAVQDVMNQLDDDSRRQCNEMETNFLAGNSEMTIDSERSEYVRTHAMEEADYILKKAGCVILSGPPGCGKTFTAHALLRRFSSQGFKPYIFRQIGEWDSHIGQDRRSVVLLDGLFGEVWLNEEQHTRWENIMGCAMLLVKEGTCKLLITIYPHVLRQLRRLEKSKSPLRDVNAVVHLPGTLPEHVKEKFLYFYLDKLHLETERQRRIVEEILDKDASGPVFPWCCDYMVKKWSSSEDPTAIFLTPAVAHAQLLTEMIADNTHGTIFAAVFALTMKGVSHFLHNLSTAAPHLKELGFSNIDDDTLAKYEDVLHGYVLSEGTFSSRVLYEAACLALGSFFRFPTMLRVCDPPFLVQYVHTPVVNMPGGLPSKVYVTLGSVTRSSTDTKLCSDDCQSLAERIYTLITEGNLLHISQHPSLQCPQFLQELDNYCAKDSKRINQLLDAVDPVHKLPLVYWSAFHPSPHLTRWCLSKPQANKKQSTRLLMACSLFDHLTQSSECRLQSFLHTTLNPEQFQHPECAMNFPLLTVGQYLTRDTKKQVNTIRGTGSAEQRLQYLCDPSMPIPPDVVTVQVTHDNVQLQVKNRHHWYLVFRLLTDRQVSDTDRDGNSLLHVAVESAQLSAVRLSLKAGAVITQQNRQGVTPYHLTRTKSSLISKKNYRSVDQVFRSMCDLDKVEMQLLLLQGMTSVNDKDSEGRTGLLEACSEGREDIAELYIELGADVNVLAPPLKFTVFGYRNVFKLHTPLHYACENGMVRSVELLIQHQADVTSTTGEGSTALHFACKCPSHTASADITCLLLRAGADVNAKDSTKNTPLMWAVERGHADTAKMLLEHGADVNAKDSAGHTPLWCAVRGGHTNTSKLLMEHGADVNTKDSDGCTPLMWAVREGHADTAKQLMEHGADVNTKDSDGCTPLMWAVRSHTDTAKQLMEHGADVNTKDSDGWTPLMWAVERGHTDTAKQLMEHGADVNTKDSDGCTPLMWAVRRGHTDTAKLLMEHGADVNTKDSAGRTPLMYAAERGHTDTAKQLMEHGADVNTKNSDGWTPLMWAVRRGHTDTAKLLLEHGSDINTKDCAGRTPLMYAVYHCHADTAKLLLEHGADVNTKDIDGNTPLIYAAKRGHTDTAKLLMEHSADVNAKDSAGKTPLMWAVESGDACIVKLLLEYGADVNARSKGGLTALTCVARRGRSDIVKMLKRHGAHVKWTPLRPCSLELQTQWSRNMATSKDYSQDDASTDTNDDTMSTGSVRDDVIQAPLSVNRTAHSAVQDVMNQLDDDSRRQCNEMETNFLAGNSEMTIDSERSEYVRTHAMEEADYSLKKAGCVILSGPPGCGKTFTAHALLRRFSSQGFKPYIFRQIGEWDSHIGQDRPCVVLLDGLFGKVWLNEEQHTRWENIMGCAMLLVKEGTCKLLITVYPHVLRQFRWLEKSKSPLRDVNAVVHLPGTLPEHVKEKFLYFYLDKLRLETERQRRIVEEILEKDASGPVFPWCCDYMVKKWSSSEDPTAIFLTPAVAHAQLLTEMIEDNTHGTIFAAVFALTMKGVSHFLHNLSTAAPYLKELGFSKIDDDTLAKYEDVLHGYVLSEGTFSSRVLYEAACLALGSFFRFPTMLRVCDPPFLVQYVHTTVVNMPGGLPSKVYVTLGSVTRSSTDTKLCSDDCQSLAERIYTLITEGNLLHISQHPSLQCPQFLQELDNYCAKDSKRINQLLDAVDPVHKLPLVYWSAFHPSPHLTRWCLSKIQANKKLSTRFMMACSLFDHLTQSSECRLQSFLHTTLNPEQFQHPECVMNFPLLTEGQCLTRDTKKQVNTIRGTGSAEQRLQYLCDPSMPIPPGVVTVQVTHDNVQLQVKDRHHWYLVFRLLTDRQVSDTDRDGNSLLHVAVLSGLLSAVRLSLKAGAVITQQNRQGVTPYHLAHTKRSLISKKNYRSVDQVSRSMCDLDKVEMQLLLLQGMTSVNDKDSEGRTGLLVACSEGREDIAELYIELGADVNVRAPPSEFSLFHNVFMLHTPLHYVCENGMVRTVELLIQHQADVTSTTGEGSTALHFVCKCPAHTASADITRLLLRAGADVNAKDSDGCTPLMWAGRGGHTNTSKLLMEHGADVNAKDILGHTPLMCAVRGGHADTAKLLMEHGTDINTKNCAGHTPLMCAVRGGHTDTAKLLMEHGADINTKNSAGHTPLMCAVRGGHTDTAKLLMEHGADVNTKNSDGWTPLIWAVREGHTDTAKLLMEHGADINTKDCAGRTPLMCSVIGGHTDTAKLLMEHGADINTKNSDGCTQLMWAVERGYADTAKLLLEHSADINTKDSSGCTPLMCAVMTGHTRIAKLLMEDGADINTKNSAGWTSLMYAVRRGQTDTAKLMLEHGADVNTKNSAGHTPLMCAVRGGQTDTAKLMLEHGADVNTKDSAGRTPLMYAIRRGHADTAKLLMEHDADVNTKDSAGCTPLMWAVERGYADTAKLLLEHGADVNTKNSDGWTPLMWAVRGGHANIAKLLMEHSADVNTKDSAGHTPLMYTVIGGHADTTKLLMEHGADVNTKDSAGCTPLMCAVYHGHADTAKLLLEHGADVNAKNSAGCTTLVWAVIGGHINTAKLLLEYSADVNAHSNGGLTALTCAAERGRSDIVKMLKSHGAHVKFPALSWGRTPLRPCSLELQTQWSRNMATSKDYSQDDASTDTNDDTMSTGSVPDDVIQAPLSVNRTAHSAVQDVMNQLDDDSRLQCNEMETNFLAGNSEMTIDSERSEYVRTHAMEEADYILKKAGCVILSGPPGCGKTFTAHALLRRFSSQGFKPYIFQQIGEWNSHIGQDRRSVVLLDGLFGEVWLNEEQHTRWENIMGCAMLLVKEGTCKLLITVYPHVLRQLRRLEKSKSPLRDVNAVVHLPGTLPEHVKEKFLNFHLDKLDLETERQRRIVEEILEKDASGPVFPWCCDYMVNKWSSSEDPTAIFLTPAVAHAQLLTEMIADNTHGTIFAAVFALTMKGVSHFLHNLSTAAPHLKELGFSNIDDDTLAKYEDVLHGYVLSEGTFSSRVLYEAACLALGSFFRFPTMLRVCDLPFLVQYVHTPVVNMPGGLPSKVYVTLGSVTRSSTDTKLCSDDCQSLAERIYTLITEGNLLHISQHPSLQCPQFLQELDNYCAKDSKRINQLLDAVDPVHRLPLVYWSAFHPSPHLTRWCLSKPQANKKQSTRLLMACSLFDHLTQSSKCRLQSFLHTTLNPEQFQHPECVMNFPLLTEGQCLTRDTEKQVNAIRGTGSAEQRLQYLCDPSMPIPHDVVTVQVTHDNVQLQVKDRRHWYLVFRLLTDRQVSDTDRDGNSLLHVAVESAQLSAVRLSLKAGAVITQQNRQGVTPYHMTHTKRSLILKKNYRSVDQIFRSMCDLDKVEMQLLLLQGMTSVNDKDSEGRTGLLEACSEGHEDIAELYIELGADVNVLAPPLEFSRTPLHYACENGMVRSVELLIQHQADVTSTTGEGSTALHFACKCPSHTASADITCLLLRAGADVNAKDSTKNTPLMWAVERGHADTAKLLLEHGADVNTKNRAGYTPLMCAVIGGHADIAKLLMEHGADVNTKNSDGLTPLMYAVRRGHADTAKLLLEHGADVNTTDIAGRTPLMYAVIGGHTDTAKLLLEHGPDVNTKNSDGCTPLMCAVRGGHANTAKLLLEYGADVNAHNKGGLTALTCAAKTGRSDIVKMLKSHGAHIK
ncbi:uncharacterized protein LOC143275219 [Babylonia areolata]|uniref:uncharacterized protein LOC143275219 n=1 Tax=Babylonia areolata TaxID=304850 RepID=UPI003FD0A24A